MALIDRCWWKKEMRGWAMSISIRNQESKIVYLYHSSTNRFHVFGTAQAPLDNRNENIRKFRAFDIFPLIWLKREGSFIDIWMDEVCSGWSSVARRPVNKFFFFVWSESSKFRIGGLGPLVLPCTRWKCDGGSPSPCLTCISNYGCTWAYISLPIQHLSSRDRSSFPDSLRNWPPFACDPPTQNDHTIAEARRQ